MIGLALATDKATSVYVATGVLVPAVYVQMQPALTGFPALSRINWNGDGVIVPVAACIPPDTAVTVSRIASSLRVTRITSLFSWVCIGVIVFVTVVILYRLPIWTIYQWRSDFGLRFAPQRPLASSHSTAASPESPTAPPLHSSPAAPGSSTPASPDRVAPTPAGPGTASSSPPSPTASPQPERVVVLSEALATEVIESLERLAVLERRTQIRRVK